MSVIQFQYTENEINRVEIGGLIRACITYVNFINYKCNLVNLRLIITFVKENG